MSETGPFGAAAEALRRSNSFKNRKYLKLIWTKNRGTVTSEPTEDTAVGQKKPRGTVTSEPTEKHIC